MNRAERDSLRHSAAQRATPEGVGNEKIRFTLRLADGRFVSSPTHTVTTNPNLAGVFSAADEKSAAEQWHALEGIHGKLKLVLWQPCPTR